MAKAVVEVSVIPIGTGKASLSKYIAGALKILEKSRVKYELTAMGTIIEGNLDDVMPIVLKMHKSVLRDVKRVVTMIKIDERKDKKLSIKGKVETVKRKLKET